MVLGCICSTCAPGLHAFTLTHGAHRGEAAVGWAPLQAHDNTSKREACLDPCTDEQPQAPPVRELAVSSTSQTVWQQTGSLCCRHVGAMCPFLVGRPTRQSPTVTNSYFGRAQHCMICPAPCSMSVRDGGASTAHALVVLAGMADAIPMRTVRLASFGGHAYTSPKTSGAAGLRPFTKPTVANQSHFFMNIIGALAIQPGCSHACCVRSTRPSRSSPCPPTPTRPPIWAKPDECHDSLMRHFWGAPPPREQHRSIVQSVKVQTMAQPDTTSSSNTAPHRRWRYC